LIIAILVIEVFHAFYCLALTAFYSKLCNAYFIRQQQTFQKEIEGNVEISATF